MLMAHGHNWSKEEKLLKVQNNSFEVHTFYYGGSIHLGPIYTFETHSEIIEYKNRLEGESLRRRKEIGQV